MRDEKIVAVVDGLGCLRCAECWSAMGERWPTADGYPVPIYRDAHPHAFERCDSCGKVCNEEAP